MDLQRVGKPILACVHYGPGKYRLDYIWSDNFLFLLTNLTTTQRNRRVFEQDIMLYIFQQCHIIGIY